MRKRKRGGARAHAAARAHWAGNSEIPRKLRADFVAFVVHKIGAAGCLSRYLRLPRHLNDDRSGLGPKHPARSRVTMRYGASMDLSGYDLDNVARTILSKAGANATPASMAAVASVIRNRLVAAAQNTRPGRALRCVMEHPSTISITSPAQSSAKPARTPYAFRRSSIGSSNAGTVKSDYAAAGGQRRGEGRVPVIDCTAEAL
jgi:hypothetical protein